MRIAFRSIKELFLIKNESPIAVTLTRASATSTLAGEFRKRRRSERDAVRDTVVTVWPNCVRVSVVN